MDGQFGALTTNSSGLQTFARPVELGLRVTKVDGGYFIQNFDPTAGNAVRVTLEEVQVFVSALLADKFSMAATPEGVTIDDL